MALENILLGLLKSREMPSDREPARKVYRRTAAGRRQLFAWLREAPDFSPERHTHVAQLAFMGQLGELEQTLQFLRQMRDQLTSRLAAPTSALKRSSIAQRKPIDDSKRATRSIRRMWPNRPHPTRRSAGTARSSERIQATDLMAFRLRST